VRGWLHIGLQGFSISSQSISNEFAERYDVSQIIYLTLVLHKISSTEAY